MESTFNRASLGLDSLGKLWETSSKVNYSFFSGNYIILAGQAGQVDLLKEVVNLDGIISAPNYSPARYDSREIVGNRFRRL